MSTVRRLVAEERGLVGKAFFITLFVAVILLIGALDVLSITVAHYHTADVAQSAAFDAAQSYKDSGSIQQACDVALVDAQNAGLKMAKHGCDVNTTDGSVTVTLRTTAGTFVVKRVSFLKKYGKAQASESAVRPP